MARHLCTVSFAVEFDDEKTDAESIATALGTVMETGLSTPGILEEYGEVSVADPLVADDGLASDIAT